MLSQVLFQGWGGRERKDLQAGGCFEEQFRYLMYEPSIIVTLRCAFPRASTPQLPLGLVPGRGSASQLDQLLPNSPEGKHSRVIYTSPTLSLLSLNILPKENGMSTNGGKREENHALCPSHAQLGRCGGPRGSRCHRGPLRSCPCRNFQGPISKSVFLPLMLSYSTSHLFFPPMLKAAN